MIPALIIRAGRLAHRNFMDVDFLAMEVKRTIDGGCRLFGFWIRRDFGAGELVYWDKPDTLHVKPEQLGNWRQV